MSTHVILVDLLATLLVVIGLHLAFRQRLVRLWLDALRERRGLAPLRSDRGEEDPLHYAMIIFGTMMMAFGLIMFSFTTVYALAT
ncbi:MAG: hypothetical protein JWO25_1217 [Alphaproteobacteria bacterium]|nr:hypothetical protein [Alphaproteobacteria bacterium]